MFYQISLKHFCFMQLHIFHSWKIMFSFRGGIYTKVATRNVISTFVFFSSSAFHPWQFDTFWNPFLYAFNSKNGHEQDSKEIFLFCILFRSCFAILQLCVCFQYPIFIDHAILKNLYILCSLSLVKIAIHTPKVHMNKPSEWE